MPPSFSSLARTASAMMAGAGLGSLLFGGLGAAVTVVMAGGLIALVGAWGSLWHPDVGNS